MKVRFSLKKPNNSGRKTFSIIRDKMDEVSRTQKKVEDSRIDAINHLVEKKLKDPTSAEIELRAIIAELKETEEKLRRRETFTDANLRILDAYWAHEIEGRDINKKAARHRLEAAIEAISTHSLASASREDLETALKNKCRGNPRKQRRHAAALNQLLKFLKRDDFIRLMKKPRIVVNYLTQEELEVVCRAIEDENDRTLVRVAFATGGRIGEIVAFENPGKLGRSLFISSQYDREGNFRETKTQTERHAYILPGFEKDLKKWFALPFEVKAQYQEQPMKIYRTLTKTCERLFDNPTKHCSIHDMRHSYAIHLIQRGVSMALVAQSLGNSVSVCEEYYSGFQLKPEGIDMIDQTLRRPYGEMVDTVDSKSTAFTGVSVQI